MGNEEEYFATREEQLLSQLQARTWVLAPHVEAAPSTLARRF